MTEDRRKQLDAAVARTTDPRTRDIQRHLVLAILADINATTAAQPVEANNFSTTEHPAVNANDRNKQLATVRTEFLEVLSKESQTCIVLTLLAIKDDIHRLDINALQDHVEELLSATTVEEE